MIANSTGKATILYSLELNELMAVCDRMAIFYKGKIIDIINPRKYTLEQVSKLLIGVKK
jgi:simple sugar transport system ATP-binding protein